MPNTVSYLGLILESVDGVVASTPLVPVSLPLELELSDKAGLATRATLIGVSNAELGNSMINEAPIRPRRTDESALTAQFVLAGEVDDGQARLEPAAPYDFSADWLPRCAHPFDDPETLIVDTNCAAEACDSRLISNGCQLRIENQGCNLGRLEGQLTTTGMTLQDEGLRDCRSFDGEPERRFVCDSLTAACRIDFWRPPFEPLFTARSKQVAPASTKSLPSTGVLVEDAIRGLARVGNRVFLARYPGGAVAPFNCQGDPTELVELDLNLEVVDTSTLPPCVSDLVVDPLGRGLLVFSGLPAKAFVTDLSGHVLLSRALDPPEQLPFRIVGTAERIVVLKAQDDTDEPGSVQALNPANFDVDWTQPIPDGRDVALGTAADVAVLDGPDVRLFDWENGSPRIVTPFEGICGSDINPWQLHVARDHISVTSIGVTAGIRTVTDESATLCTRGFPFEYPRSVPFAFAPYDGQSVLVGLTTAEGTALISLARDGEVQFLPGAVEVGEGIVQRFEVGPDAIFATIPWSGTIVRLDRRE